MAHAAGSKKKYSWVGSAASLLAVLSCYGTLASVALLSLMGICTRFERNVPEIPA